MCALRGRGGVSGQKDSWHLRLEIYGEKVSNTIDTVQKDYLILELTDDRCDDNRDDAGGRL